MTVWPSAKARRAFLPLLVCASLAAPAVRAAGASEAEVAAAASRITAASAFATVEVLAAPEMAGRLSGTEGYAKAVTRIAAEVRKAGLRPPADLPDYKQAFTHGLAGIEAASLTLLPAEGEKDGKPYEAEVLKDWSPMVNGGSGDVTAGGVFVGYGFDAPAAGRDDYAGVHAEGKDVLGLRGEPEGREWKDHRSTVARTNAAARKGAAGLLLIDSPVTSTSVGISRDLPEAMVSEAFADRLLAGKKLTVAELRKVLSKGALASFATGSRLRFSVKGRPWREVTTHNVVALLPGSDPSVKGEYVVVGAHLDHIGDWPRLNPGADDNASG
ncbi:MAG TPA: M28 family peptidase, partial [Thermoanaerobaculia bacterium]|nr:M28 family peptidase [Thermoanaerobaculia bacterium]